MSIHDINSMVDYLKKRFPDNGKTTGQSVQAVCGEVERAWSELESIREVLEMQDQSAEEIVRALKIAIDTNAARIAELAMLKAPIPMVIHCPCAVDNADGTQRVCGARHVDKGRFVTHPHHTHSCQTCGQTWRHALVSTVGVEFLPGFKDAK